MAGENKIQSSSDDILALQERILDLESRLTELQTTSLALWELLMSIGSRLQMSSTSVKMAVSSLLDYEIFWDPSTSHEFLQVIDSSTDLISDLVILLTLAFRSQAKSLEINIEPNSIQEILESLQASISNRYSEARLTVEYPPDGKLVLVDYQYLVVALTLLFDAYASEKNSLKQLKLETAALDGYWQLKISDLDMQAVNTIQQFFDFPRRFKEYASQLLPENTLKLIVACRILRLQKIELLGVPSDVVSTLCINIPAVESKA